MRICHMTSVHPSSDIRIFEKECKSLAKSGHEVYLVAPSEHCDYILDGIHMIGLHKPKSRIVRILFFSRKVYKRALKINAEVYHFHDPELLPYAYRLKKLGKKVIYDSHEDVPRQIMGKTWIPSFFRRSISFVVDKIEKVISKKLDIVITVSPHIAERFIQKGINNVEIISNVPIITKFSEKKGDIPNRPVNICFAGGISEQWMHKNIISCLKECKTNYVLAGVGENKYIDSLKKDEGWKNVDYRGKVSHEEVKKIYVDSIAGMALNSYNANVGYKKGTLGNTKLFEYMESGIPVICTDFELWKNIINKWDCGICVNPYDKKQISKAIMYIKSHPERAKEMGENGRKAVEIEYNWAIEEQKLLKIYERI